MRALFTVVATPLHGYPSFFRTDEQKIKEKY
jgi:hypothetical protein